MSVLRAVLVKALLIPLALALSLSACSSASPALPSPQPAASAGGTRATTVADPQAPTAHTLAVKKYTMAQVKRHHTKTNCWSVVGRNVYKLTTFIRKHPGGAKRIIAMCGKNATAAFRGQHGTGGRANTTLKKYKIGVLA
ncbi:MAG: cytochrome b5 domain-containing protein [Propionicimonas sp.]